MAAIDLQSLTTLFCFWQLTYLLCARLTSYLLSHPSAPTYIPSKPARDRLRRQAPAYLVSTVHALLAASRGLQHFHGLFYAPPAIKLQRPASLTLPPAHLPYALETDRVPLTNALLASYLLCDLIHVLRLYPTIGGPDTVLHHVAFLLCALVAGTYELCPFMFSWLIIGEASTPLLNARWLLIRTGRGSAPYFEGVELAFVAVFVLTRFFLYGAGLAHHISILKFMPPGVPPWAARTTMGFVVAGFLLNLVWLRKMYKMATGAGRRKRDAAAEKRRKEGEIVGAKEN